jgi:hypothetical protein
MHRPQTVKHNATTRNDAIDARRINKEIIEHTSAVIKYQDGQAFVKGESEYKPLTKVLDTDAEVLKSG